MVAPYQGAQIETVNGLQSLNLVGTVYNGQNNQSSFDLKCIDFKNAYEGFVGGNYSDGLNSSRLVFDMSGEFSTLFWYDKLGRIVVSQNTKQQFNHQYSYTLYDGLGRVMEAGQKDENNTSEPQFLSIFGTSINGHYNIKAIDDQKLSDWIKSPSGTRRQVTRTLYDIPVTEAGGFVQFALNPPLTQTHLRKRVSAVFYQEVFEEDIVDYNQENGAVSEAFNFTHATYYSYDIHGNVNTLVQDIPSMTLGQLELAHMRYKKLEYQYDLISGNVHEVNYQKNEADAWHHHYEYDADNRIQRAYTSTNPTPVAEMEEDGIGWDLDAQYYYYQHGPLARVELGQNKVQGVDYGYTIQGWLKGVNSNQREAHLDMGRDGHVGGVNQFVAQDAFSFSLGYFEGDYQQISSSSSWNMSANGSLLLNRENLWNGNIGYMLSNLAPATGATINPTDKVGLLGMSYRYDQLNRLREAKSSEWNGSSWQNGANDMYYNGFQYDANGNILSQTRKNHLGVVVDELDYHYLKNSSGELLANRLYHVNDNSGVAGDGDIGNTLAVALTSGGVLDVDQNNYLYTEIGELKEDKLEGIEEIIWRVDSKIDEIHFTAASGKNNLKFLYDVTGNRIAKMEMMGQTSIIRNATYYARDAQGNVMAVYKYGDEMNGGTPVLTYRMEERHIYGSSRIGMNTQRVEWEFDLAGAETTLTTVAPNELGDTGSVEHLIGAKQYELSNHLGNVLAVISDIKVPVASGTVVSYYESVVISSQDYSPFGVTLSGRSWSEGYRYGFNGKENLVESNVTTISFENRTYNSNLAVFFSLDVLVSSSVYRSPYSFAELNPILFIDDLGDNPIVGQLKSLPNGTVALRLTSGPVFSKFNWSSAFHQNMLLTSLARPGTNPEIALRQFDLWIKDGFMGISHNDATDKMVTGRRAKGIHGGIAFFYEIYKTYEVLAIQELKNQDQQKINEYQYNLETVSYLLKESAWLMDSFTIASKRGVFKDLNIEVHGKGFQVDLANYALLANTNLLEGNESSIEFEGNLNGLTRKEYLGKLASAFTAMRKDVIAESTSTVQVDKVNHISELGGRQVVNFKVTLTKIRSRSYRNEPIAPKKKKI